MAHHLGSGGDHWHQLSELRTEIMDASIVNLEEIACLGLLWKTSFPVKTKPRDVRVEMSRTRYHLEHCSDLEGQGFV